MQSCDSLMKLVLFKKHLHMHGVTFRAKNISIHLSTFLLLPADRCSAMSQTAGHPGEAHTAHWREVSTLQTFKKEMCDLSNGEPVPQ